MNRLRIPVSLHVLLPLLMLIGFGVLLVFSVPGQPCHVDEAWMAEQSWWEMKDGVPRQALLEGMYHFEERMLIRHKLHIAVGDLAIRIAGFHLWVLRMIPLMAGLGLFLMMYRYLRKREDRPGEVFLLSAVVLLATPVVFRYLKVFRPEFILAAFGFLSFLLLLRTLEERRGRFAFLSGGMAGLAFLSHLNGVAFIMAGMVVLLLERQYRYALFYCFAALAVGSLYSLDIIGNPDLFREQLRNDFVVGPSGSPLLKVIEEHERYFRTPEIFGISALWVLSLAPGFREKTARHRTLYRYLLFLVVVLGAVGKSLTVKYAIPVLPFFALSIGITFSMLLRAGDAPGRAMRWLLVSVVAIHIGYGFWYAEKTAMTGKVDLAANHAIIARSMTKGAKVLAPARFIFDEIGRYEIRDLFAARYLITKRDHRPFNLTSLCEYAQEGGFDYILLDEEYRRFGHINPRRVYGPVWGYEVTKIYTDGTILMERYASTKSRGRPQTGGAVWVPPPGMFEKPEGAH